MDLSTLQGAEQRWKLADQTRSREPPVCLAFAHAEAPRAEVEHRRARGLQVEAPCLDLAEMNEQARGESTAGGADRGEVRHHFFIGEAREVHGCFIHQRRPLRAALSRTVT